ncbi:PEPxxWA-CTERM sorting domain-containing protein [Sphingobium nicotianae]|uniref:PEP-CTERM sorting domain-containing protein n=1 Tax=Sphingobium nicotianae TaxID=2782607 RepID=A0A9X1DCD3_9SPHN|nr:PEPxxWA-CTERM sorting domain-containing protein [Sphingobium nicotianae]MBT2187421.1 PEP-CTERM sorting domain-containing protein [Sphingobium nicotianae]
MFRKMIFAAALLGGTVLGAGADAQSITIAPGSGPAGGYLGLSLFGIGPIANLTGDGSVSLNIPGITFGGQSWTSLTVAENGFVTLGNAAVPGSLWTSANLSLPAGGVTAPILAPYWTDIDSTGGAIRAGTLTDGTHSWVVIDWDSVLLPSSTARSSFELWMGVGFDDVTYSYAAMGSTAAFTIGAQDASGTIGTNYLYNNGSISRSELRVTSTGLPVTPSVPEPASWAMMIAGLGVVGGVLRRRQIASVRFA